MLDGSARQVQLAREDLDTLRLGYAQHVYRQQGATVERSVIVTGGWQTSKETAYVEASRARAGTDWFLARDELGDRRTGRHPRQTPRRRHAPQPRPNTIPRPPRTARSGLGTRTRPQATPLTEPRAVPHPPTARSRPHTRPGDRSRALSSVRDKVRTDHAHRRSSVSIRESRDMTPSDDDFAFVARLSAELQEEMLDDSADVWMASPFAWIREQPSARKGAIAVAILRTWATDSGLTTTRAKNSDHDLIIEELKIEVKLSTLWANGDFRFQQLRDQDYEHVCLLGLEPQAVRLWIVPKTVVLDHARGQHTGESGRDTAWLNFKAASPPSWLNSYGSTLSAARRYLEETSRERRS